MNESGIRSPNSTECYLFKSTWYVFYEKCTVYCFHIPYVAVFSVTDLFLFWRLIMIKKKIAAFAAAAITACSIGTTALAAGVYGLNFSITEGTVLATKQPRVKDNPIYAQVYVDSGLNTGDTFLTFSTLYDNTDTVASYESDLWVNAMCKVEYKPGFGKVGEDYRLKIYMEPQANAHTLYIKGSWTP